MGCAGSKKKVRIRRNYRVNERKPGQGREALRDFRTIGLTDAEIDYLFNIFLQIDRDESGEIDVGEFYGYFDLERTEYTDRVYETMDMDSSGEVDFHEFVLFIWFTASMDVRTLPDFVFTLYDTDKDGLLYKTEVRQIIRDTYGHLYDNNHHIREIAADIQSKQPIQLTRDQFRELNTEHAVLLFPAFRVQQQLRRNVFDEEFWRDQLKERMKMGVHKCTSIQDTLASITAWRKGTVQGVGVPKPALKPTAASPTVKGRVGGPPPPPLAAPEPDAAPPPDAPETSQLLKRK